VILAPTLLVIVLANRHGFAAAPKLDDAGNKLNADEIHA
jgi:hypothetical protein